MGNGKRAGKLELGRHVLEPRIAGDAVGELIQIDVERAEPHAGRDLGRGLPAIELRTPPVEESALPFVAHTSVSVPLIRAIPSVQSLISVAQAWSYCSLVVALVR